MIPERISKQAVETARAYNRDWENGVDIIEAALLAAEQRGREMEREDVAKQLAGLSAQFSVNSHDPSKSEDSAEFCRINSRMLDGLASAIRSRTTEG